MWWPRWSVKLTGPGVFAAALAVGLAMVAMHLTKSFHPPAGIDPLVVVLNDMSSRAAVRRCD
jgi:CBS-domain-containing membrane protein